jgi:hypothetical protein
MILTNVWAEKSRQAQRAEPALRLLPSEGTRTPCSVGRETAPGTHAEDCK